MVVYEIGVWTEETEVSNLKAWFESLRSRALALMLSPGRRKMLEKEFQRTALLETIIENQIKEVKEEKEKEELERLLKDVKELKKNLALLIITERLRM